MFTFNAEMHFCLAKWPTRRKASKTKSYMCNTHAPRVSSVYTDGTKYLVIKIHSISKIMVDQELVDGMPLS